MVDELGFCEIRTMNWDVFRATLKTLDSVEERIAFAISQGFDLSAEEVAVLICSPETGEKYVDGDGGDGNPFSAKGKM